MIVAEQLTKYYDDRPAVADVSFTINEGEVISLVGGNGAGKSTMLRIISGLMKPRSGEILFDQQPIHTL